MRKGEYIDTVKTEETSIQELTNKMVGDVVELKIDREIVEQTKPLLEIRELKVLKDDQTVAIDDMSFYIRGGEILGVAGISGCGQKELCEAIAGLRKVQSGKICHKGESILGMSPKAIIQKGISMSFIPEDRLGMRLALSLNISDNVILKDYKKNRTISPQYKTQADEIARVISNKLELNHTAEEWLNALDKMF